MSVLSAIKGIRSELAREIEAAKKAQEQMAAELSSLTARLKANEGALEAKIRMQAGLDAIQREAEQAVSATEMSPKASVRQRPDEVTRKPSRLSKEERQARKLEKAIAKASKGEATSNIRIKKNGEIAKKPGRKTAVTASEAASQEMVSSSSVDGATVTKVQTASLKRSANTRPPIKEALQQVIGDKVMNRDAMLAELKNRGWVPDSNDPRTYLAYILSSNKDLFENVKGQGYRCRTEKMSSNESVKVERIEEASPVESPEVSIEEALTADDILNDAGILGSPAFGG